MTERWTYKEAHNSLSIGDHAWVFQPLTLYAGKGVVTAKDDNTIKITNQANSRSVTIKPTTPWFFGRIDMNVF